MNEIGRPSANSREKKPGVYRVKQEVWLALTKCGVGCGVWLETVRAARSVAPERINLANNIPNVFGVSQRFFIFAIMFVLLSSSHWITRRRIRSWLKRERGKMLIRN